MLAHVGPSWSQVGPKLTPRSPQVGPCWTKLAQVGPCWPRYRPKLAHVGPCWPQVGPMMANPRRCRRGLPGLPRRLCLQGLGVPRRSQRLCLTLLGLVFARASTKALPPRSGCSKMFTKTLPHLAWSCFCSAHSTRSRIVEWSYIGYN